MSRRLGRIERAILDIIGGDHRGQHHSYAAEDLAVEVYRLLDEEKSDDDRRLARAHVFVVLRAMHSLARKFPDRVALTGGKGRESLWLAHRESRAEPTIETNSAA